MKPVIGISSDEVQNKHFPWHQTTYGQCRTYTDAVFRAGGIPVIIPPTEKPATFSRLVEKLDGLLLAGGVDINPLLYGESQHPETKLVSKIRDKTELYLLEKFLEADKPVFGICRGMQLINVYYGGTLHQDIPSELTTHLDHQGSTHAKDSSLVVHQIRIEAGTKVSNILNATSIDVNSCHHQAIKKLGHGLEAVAWAEDSIIEAIEDKNSDFVLGIQAHPEALEGSTVPEWQKMFKSFVRASQESALEKVLV